MSGTSSPSDLELQALSVVYAEGASTVATVLAEMPDQRERAYTTVLSVMQSLERKGLVKSKREGRAYVYCPTKSQESIVAPLAKDFVQNAFGGSVGSAILLLLSIGKLTPEEKSAVECELRNHKAMAAKKKTTKKKTAVKRKIAKKLVKKAAKKKVAKKIAKKVIKKKVAKKVAKKAVKKAIKKKIAKKVAKKAVKKAVKKAAKKKAKTAVKKTAKKAARKVTKKATKKATKKKATKKKVARKRK